MKDNTLKNISRELITGPRRGRAFCLMSSHVIAGMALHAVIFTKPELIAPTVSPLVVALYGGAPIFAALAWSSRHGARVLGVAGAFGLMFAGMVSAAALIPGQNMSGAMQMFHASMVLAGVLAAWGMPTIRRDLGARVSSARLGVRVGWVLGAIQLMLLSSLAIYPVTWGEYSWSAGALVMASACALAALLRERVLGLIAMSAVQVGVLIATLSGAFVGLTWSLDMTPLVAIASLAALYTTNCHVWRSLRAKNTCHGTTPHTNIAREDLATQHGVILSPCDPEYASVIEEAEAPVYTSS